MAAERHDGQPGRAARADPAGRRRDRGRESHAVWHETGAGAANAGVQFTAVGAGRRSSPWTSSSPRSSRAGTSSIRRRRSSRSRTRTIAPAASCSRRTRSSASARPRASAASPRTSTARACGTPRSLAGDGRPSSRRRSTWSAASVEGTRRAGRVAAGRTRADSTGVRPLPADGRRGDAPGRASSPRPACTPSTTTSTGSPRTMPMPGLIAERLASSRRVVLDLATVQTNIVVFDLTDDAPDAATVVAAARERGVLVVAFGPRTSPGGHPPRRRRGRVPSRCGHPRRGHREPEALTVARQRAACLASPRRLPIGGTICG